MSPLTPTDFAALMAPLAATRRVAVACSGGADSLALTLLAAAWGDVLALIVDHGLRESSAAEAAVTQQRLAARGIAARVLTLTGVKPTAAAARVARYAALEAACLAEGRLDLLLAHHRRDQAETVLIRRDGGSGAAGLAAMPAVTETLGLRLLRPLLSIPPGRLRATLRSAGLDWVEDPSNADPARLRARLRAGLDDPAGDGAATRALAASAAVDALARRAEEAASAAWLARHATLRPEGFAVLRPEGFAVLRPEGFAVPQPEGIAVPRPGGGWPGAAIPAPALASLLRMLSGAAYAPPAEAVAQLAAKPGPATLWGVRIMPAGRLGPGLLCVREAAAMAAPIQAVPGAVWDRRFRLVGGAGASIDASTDAPQRVRDGAMAGATLGAVGADAACLRKLTNLPAAVLQTLPALRLHGALVAVPHIGYGRAVLGDAGLIFCPANPAAGAPFQGCRAGLPMRVAGGAEAVAGPHV